MDPDTAFLSRFQPVFDRINAELRGSVQAGVPLIDDMGRHTLLGDGKRLRPLVFVLCCDLCGYRTERVFRFAGIFECIHTASLLHDDVLDNAEMRRRKRSANQLWGNHAAVLVGDFLYSKSFATAVETDNLRFLAMLTRTTTRMAEGQILELVHTHDWQLTKETYLEIISSKTAVLLSAACAAGAILSDAGVAAQSALERFGMNMGIAFQLMDDLLDYTASEEVFGKPVGKDLKEGKITLPLIYALSMLDVSERSRLESCFRAGRATEEDHALLLDRVRRSGALERIREEAGAYIRRAGECLTDFPESEAKQHLLDLNTYMIERRY